MQAEIVTLTQRGGRAYNEDRLAHWSDGRHVALLLADGAGGHGGGDVAAQLACDTLLAAYAAAPTLDGAALCALLQQANAHIVERQGEGGALAHMRSTCVLAALDLAQGAMRWVHAGDSRAYLFRGQAMLARTRDHSMVEKLVAGGLLDDAQARLHPQRHVLLSALGAHDDTLEISASECLQVQPGDVVLLCSDGLWEPLGDAALARSLQHCGSPSQWAQLLHSQVGVLAAPGHDNFSALIAWLHEDDEGQTRILA